MNLANALGGLKSTSPGITITQASPATPFFTESIPAGALMPVRWYRLRMSFKLTTPPLLGIPGLSIVFSLGGQTFAINSTTVLLAGITNGLVEIEFIIVATGDNTQMCFCKLTQPNGSILPMTTSANVSVGTFNCDSTKANTLICTIQFTGSGLGASKLENFWILRDPI